MILSTPEQINEFIHAFKGSRCIYKHNIHSALSEFYLGPDNMYINVHELLTAKNWYFYQVTPTEKALRYLYKLVSEDYDNHR